jgi:hypothetical protein
MHVLPTFAETRRTIFASTERGESIGRRHALNCSPTIDLPSQ